MKQEIVEINECGCEFTIYISEDGNNSFCVLTKCRCQKHYEEQLKAEWYDGEGHHSIIRDTKEVAGLLPLEAQK